MKANIAVSLSVLALAFFSCAAAFSQGLSPTAPPGPTFKTLDQVKPGTPISSLPFTINTPGFYYLAKDLTGPTGINATVSNVTIDLNGFTLTGPGAGAGGTAAGIVGVNDTVVRNGRVAAWPGDGVRLGAAVVVENLDIVNCGNNCITTGEQARVSSSRVGAASKSGMVIGDNSVIDGCTSIGSTGGATGIGIQVGATCTVSNSVSSFNFNEGIVTGDNSIVSKCTVAHNGHSIVGYGMRTGDHCVVQSCDASANTVTFGLGVGAACLVDHCVIAGSAGTGLFMNGGDSTARECIVSGTGTGIELQGDRCRLTNCTISGCTDAGGEAAYIHGSGNLIEGNHIRGNAGNGMFVAGSKNVIIRNEAGDNVPSYNIQAGNNVGPIGTPENSTSPFANLLN